MKQTIAALLTTIALTHLSRSYIDIKDQHQHFKNIYSNDYVLVVFYNSKSDPKTSSQVRKSITSLEDNEVVQDNKVLVEFIDTSNVGFFDKHYDLDGKHSVRLFIRNQMEELVDFDSYFNRLKQSKQWEAELTEAIERFVDIKIKEITVELSSINQFRELLVSKQILGLFSGNRGSNFERYFHVARKNIDFSFAHSFDKDTARGILAEFGNISPPEGDFFAIVKTVESLNEFDTEPVIFFNDFKEKPLTEFIEFNRFSKLRDPEDSNETVKRIFFKHQPVLLYVKSPNTESKQFEIFKETVKALPRQLIYTYTEADSLASSAFLQLFMLAEKLMMPETIALLWVGPSQKVKVQSFQGDFEKGPIIEFVFNFLQQNEKVLDSLKQHLYDRHDKNEGEVLNNEEL